MTIVMNATRARKAARCVSDGLNVRDVLPKGQGRENGVRFERAVVDAARGLGYPVSTQVKFAGITNIMWLYVADLVITKWFPDGCGGEQVVISCKFQANPGTAEQKVTEEIEMLAELVAQGHADRAHLVVDGSGWSPRMLDRILAKANASGIEVFSFDDMVDLLRADAF